MNIRVEYKRRCYIPYKVESVKTECRVNRLGGRHPPPPRVDYPLVIKGTSGIPIQQPEGY